MSQITYPTLYKLDSKGKVRQWTISVVPNEPAFDSNTACDVLIMAGLKGGKLVPTRYTVSEGKNLGKTNATTPYTQAQAEAKAKWELQVRAGYVENEADLKQFTLASGLPNPMLAHKYDPTGKQKGSKTLAKMKLEGKQIAVQPKFDGNRCLIKVARSYVSTYPTITVQMFTRKGDPMLPVPHIITAISGAYSTSGLDSELILDGELFTDAFSFNTLNGLLRKEDKSDAQKAQLEQVDFRLYDVMRPVGYELRRELLAFFYGGPIKETETVFITATDENIRTELERFLAQGHEGLMIRDLETPYENKRSWSLVKCKLFEDEEFELVDVEEDARAGFVGAFVMKLPAPTKDRDGKEVTVFRAGVSGLTQEEGAEILRNKSKYIGRIATVEFFGRSEYGIPRFGKMKAFRD